MSGETNHSSASSAKVSHTLVQLSHCMLVLRMKSLPRVLISASKILTKIK